jgi:predicted permease
MSIFEWLRWRPGRGGDALSDQLSDEIRAHLEMAEADRIARGESADDAAHNARREFGNVALAYELARDQWAGPGQWVERLAQDLRFALRVLRRAPGFTAASILTIAVGVGACTALFSVVDATLLRPLPYPHPERLVRIEDDLRGLGSRDVGMSTPEWRDLERSGLFEFVSPAWYDDNNLTGLARPQRVSMLIVAPNYFSLLGVRPQLGATFAPNDKTPGFNGQVVISDGLWKRGFGADPHVLGRVVQLDSDSYRIIGVMPPGFQAPGPTQQERGTEVWPAFGFAGAPMSEASVQSRASVYPETFARLEAGHTIAEAQRRIDALVESLRRQYPAAYPPAVDWHVRLVPLQESLTGDVRQPLLFLLGAVALVLLIGCANVANLTLARSTTRGREMAVRQALGGAPARLIRQLLTETIVLAVLGGALGVALLLATRSSLVRLVPAGVPRLNDIAIDWNVAGFAFAASVAAGVCFGIAPALRIRRLDVTRVLREEGSRATPSADQKRMRRLLVAGEFAVSLMLLSACGLLMRSVWDLLHAPLGYDPTAVTVVRTRLPYPNDPREDHYGSVADESPFVREVLRRCLALPGVVSAALGSGAAVPLDHPAQDQNIFRVVFDRGTGRSDQPLIVTGSLVTPEYFSLLSMSLVRGRLFDDHDTDHSPSVAVVNEAMAHAYWPSEDPIGKRIKLSPRDTSWMTIVGVVANARTESLTGADVPLVFGSLYQRQGKHLAIFLRGRFETATIERQVRAEVQSIDSALPVFGGKALSETVVASIAVRRLSLELIGLFALTALFLAGIGIYGVVSYMVNERTGEIGLRLALGAERADVMRLLMGQGLAMAFTGGIAGVVGALIVSRVLAGTLLGVPQVDPLSLAASAAALTAVAFMGCYLPARRVIRVEPAMALRS